MDIHDEIYRNKTPDLINLDGKATPDSGFVSEVGSYLDKDQENDKARPETIVEDAEGETASPRNSLKSEVQDDQVRIVSLN